MINYCIVCNGNKWKSKYSILDQCMCCGFIKAKNYPTENNLTRIYSKKYYFGEEYSDYLLDRVALDKNFNNRIKYIQKFINLTNTKCIEVGCAYGFFLKMINNYKSSAIGFDVSISAVKYAANKLHVDARSTSFLNFTPRNKVDLCVMWDVVEHLNKPSEFLAHAYSITKKNGYIFLTTGDIDSILSRLQGPKWRQIHPPTHLNYFSKKTISSLLENIGYSVIAIKYPSFYRNCGSVINQLFTKQSYLFNFKDKLSNLFNDSVFTVNTFDTMLVVAKKL